jgi:hypothetical protein
MAAAHQPPSPGEEPVTAEDVALAERRAAQAREGAAHAGLSAAHSLEESARLHEQVAQVEQRGVEQGVAGPDVPRKSVTRHQQAADEDRALAEQKRRESEANLDAT